MSTIVLKRRFKLSLLILSSLLTFACSGNLSERVYDPRADVPGWVISKKSTQFPERIYLTAVGISNKNQSAASGRARSELLKQMKAEVSGTKISLRWADVRNKTFYAFATLERKRAISFYTTRINEELVTINSLFQSALSQEEKGEKSKALNLYREAFYRRIALKPAVERFFRIRGTNKEKFGVNEIKLSAIEEKINSLTQGTSNDRLIWNDAVFRLSEQIVAGIRDKRDVMVLVNDFVDGESGGALSLSRRLSSDLRKTLTRADGLSLLEPDSSGQGDYVVDGRYWLDAKGNLKIHARLMHTKNKILAATAQAVIRGTDINSKDLVPLPKKPVGKTDREKYRLSLERFYLKEGPEQDGFRLDLWTEKSDFLVGDQLRVFFKSNRPGYLYLFDIGTSGNVTVLLPNPFQENNFIKPGKTFSFPGDKSDYSFTLSGPAGVERIKAVFSSKPIKPFSDTTLTTFYTASEKSPERMRDISAILDQLASSTDFWAEEKTEIIIMDAGSQPEERLRSLLDEKPEEPEEPIDIIGTSGRR